MWRSALTRLTRLKKSLSSLERAVQAEFVDLSAFDAAVKQSQLILHDVTHNLRTARELIGARTEQLADADKRFRILTADDLADCTTQNLEDISDVLWSGLQAATLALSRRQDQTATNDNGTTSDFGVPAGAESARAIEFMTHSVPEAKFEPALAPATTSEAGKAEELCLQLIDVLQGIRDIQKKSSYERKSLQKNLEQLQNQIRSANTEYGAERTNLLNLERKLDTRLRQVNRMTGRDSYDSLTAAQLADLCKTINKASRRLATEQAIREVRAQQQQQNVTKLSSEHPERCLVCFERDWNSYLNPCGHTLCDECAGRLKFCPQCRVAIQGVSDTPIERRGGDKPKPNSNPVAVRGSSSETPVQQ